MTRCLHRSGKRLEDYEMELLTKLLDRLIAPIIARETKQALIDSLRQTEKRFQDHIERRVERIEHDFERRFQPKSPSLSISIASLLVSTLVALIAFTSLWYQFIREKHRVNVYVLTAQANEDRASAEVVFSNEGNQTEVISGGNLIYCATNVLGWANYRSTGSNSIPSTVLKAGDKIHLAIAEPLKDAEVRPPFKLGILLYTLSNGVPIKAPYLLGTLTRPWAYLTADNAFITADNDRITTDIAGTLFGRSNVITIPLIDR